MATPEEILDTMRQLDAKIEESSACKISLLLAHKRIARTLAEFYRSPLSMSSVQPILALAEELNPELKDSVTMPEPRQPLTNSHTNGRFWCTDCGMSDTPCRHYIEQRNKVTR